MGAEVLSLHRNPPFFPRRQKEESRGAIVGILGPKTHYLYIYWVWGPIRERKVARGGVNIVKGVYVSK